MPTDPSLVDPNIEMQIDPCKEEDVIQEPAFPTIANLLKHWEGQVCERV